MTSQKATRLKEADSISLSSTSGSSEDKATAQHTAPPALNPLAYRVTDACHVMGIGRTSLYELIKKGELKAIRVAGHTLIDAASIRTLIATAPFRQTNR